MKFNVYIENKDTNKIYYIKYENGKTIELTRNNQHKILNSNKHIFLLLENELDKVFDINNRRFISKKIDMQILYNNYNDFIRKITKKKILKP